MRRGKILLTNQGVFVMASLHDEHEANCGPSNALAYAISQVEESAILCLRRACGPNGTVLKSGFTTVIVNDPQAVALIDQMQPAVMPMFSDDLIAA